jgi:hypothetical protein
MSATKFAVRLSGDPVWFEDGEEMLFDTEDDALAEIEVYLNDCAEAHALGYMIDDGSDCNFRIQEIR